MHDLSLHLEVWWYSCCRNLTLAFIPVSLWDYWFHYSCFIQVPVTKDLSMLSREDLLYMVPGAGEMRRELGALRELLGEGNVWTLLEQLVRRAERYSWRVGQGPHRSWYFTGNTRGTFLIYSEIICSLSSFGQRMGRARKGKCRVSIGFWINWKSHSIKKTTQVFSGLIKENKYLSQFSKEPESRVQSLCTGGRGEEEQPVSAGLPMAPLPLGVAFTFAQYSHRAAAGFRNWTHVTFNTSYNSEKILSFVFRKELEITGH